MTTSDNGTTSNNETEPNPDGVVVGDAEAQPHETPEVVSHDSDTDEEAEEASTGSVSEPAKVMRIGSMVRQLLEEVRATELDERGRERLGEIYDTSIAELATALSSDLQTELDNLTSPFGEGEIPSSSELRIAQAQLVGWLEGLFHGIQATLFAQQMEARQQLEGMAKAQESLPSGARNSGRPPQSGVYL